MAILIPVFEFANVCPCDLNIPHWKGAWTATSGFSTSAWKGCIVSIMFPEFQTPTSERGCTRQPISLDFICKTPTYTTPPSSSSQHIPTDGCEHQASLTQSPVFPSTPRLLYQPTGIVISPVMPPTVSAAAADAIADTYKHAYHHNRGTEAQHTPYASSSPQLDSACGLTSLPSPPTAAIPCNIRYLQGSNQPLPSRSPTLPHNILYRYI